MSAPQMETPGAWRRPGGLGKDKLQSHSASFLSRAQPLTHAEIERALFCIPSDCARAQWARIAMAAKSELGDGGQDLFQRWSMQSGNSNARDIRDTWKSIREGGAIGIGTLIHEAKRYGWRRAPQTASERARAGQAAKLQTEQRHAREQAEQQATEQRHQRAAATAATFVATLAPANPAHPYLTRKGIKPHGILQSGGSLVVPIRDVSGMVMSYQTITNEGEKRFLAGGKISGGIFVIGEPLTARTAFAVICEGAATGASLFERGGASVPTVIIAFTAGNLMAVAMAVRAAFPDIALAIAADWDGAPDGGVGVAKATDAANAVDAEVWVPVIPEAMGVDRADFNDLHLWQRSQKGGA